MSSTSAIPPSPESAASADEPEPRRPRRRPGRRVTRRTRLPQHAWAVFFAVLLVPGTIAVLAVLPWASNRVVEASGTGRALGPLAALLALTLAAAVLSWLVGWATAVFSSFTTWLYALGGWLVLSLQADRLARLEVAPAFERTLDGLRFLTEEGTAAAMVLVLAGVAAGTSISRRNGRSDERAEATTGHERARRSDQILATGLALPLTAVGAWFVTLASPGRPDGDGWASWLLLLGAVLLALSAATSGIASIGGQLAGGLIVAVALLHTSLLGTGPEPVVLDPGQSSTALSDGTLLVLGLALGLGSSGAHWARRSGKRYERTEMAIAQVSRPGDSPAGRGRRRAV